MSSNPQIRGDKDIVPNTTPWTALQSGLLVPLANGGLHQDLTATGGTGQYLKQKTFGGAITIEAILPSELPLATDSVEGAMSASDKTKLDGLPDDTGLIALVSTAIASIPDVTTSTHGLMTATDKVKLNGVPSFPLALGSLSNVDVTDTTVGHVLTRKAGGTFDLEAPAGGGTNNLYSPFKQPLLSRFTLPNIPAGSTYQDTETGLAMSTPTDGLTLLALLDTVTPTANFTVTLGVRTTQTSSNSGVGIFIIDTSGKIVTLGKDDQGATGGNINYWTNYTTFSSNPLDVNEVIPAVFFQVGYDGTNFYLRTGQDPYSLQLESTVSATAFLGTISGFGIFQFGYTEPISSTVFHYKTESIYPPAVPAPLAPVSVSWCPNPIDVPPSAPNALDDEFQTNILSGSWSVYTDATSEPNLSATSNNYGSGYLVLDSPYTNPFRSYGVHKDITSISGSPFTITCKYKLEGPTWGYNGAGITLRESLGSGKMLYFGVINDAGNLGTLPLLDYQIFNSDLSYNSEPHDGTETSSWFEGYFRIIYDGSNFHFQTSTSGLFGGATTASTWYSVSSTAWLSTIGAAGVGIYPYNQISRCIFDWVRFTSP